MPALCCLMLCTCGFGDAMDPKELAGIRASLESYLSRIQAIRIKYTERWVEDPDRPPIFKKYQADMAKRQQEQLETAPPEFREELQRLAARGKSETVREYDILDAFPSLRVMAQERKKYANGETSDSVTEIFIQGSQYVYIDKTHKQVHVGGSGERHKHARTPIEAIGLRVSGSMNMHLSELLAFPEVTKSGGTEVLDGMRCVVISVGPQLPVAARPQGWKDEDWAKIWLAVDYQHLPIRMERYIESANLGKHDMPTSTGRVAKFVRHIYELHSLQPAADVARGEAVLFPRRVTFADGAGVWNWEVHEVEINPVVNAADFKPGIQDGYAVARDGKPPTVKLSGGKPAFEKRVAETASQARDLLALSPPPAVTNESSISWRWIMPLAFVGLMVFLLVLKGRFSP